MNIHSHCWIHLGIRFTDDSKGMVNESSPPVVEAVERESAVRDKTIKRQARTKRITRDNIVDGYRVNKNTFGY